jgi:hypothetical protein
MLLHIASAAELRHGGLSMAIDQGTGTKTAALQAERERWVAASVSTQPLFVDHAHGARITDVEGREYIDFVGGIRGTGELVTRVDSGECAVAFSMYPTTLEQLMDIADAGEIMPPKSTWFEPKLRSGLFIHTF